MNSEPKTINELIAVLRKQGYNQSYSTENDEIAINCHSSLNCKIKKNDIGDWEPDISFNYTGMHFIGPFLVMNLIALIVWGNTMPGRTSAFSFRFASIIGILIGVLLVRFEKKNYRRNLF